MARRGEKARSRGSRPRPQAAGAEIRLPVTEMFWGARYGVLQDPFGHSWSVATQVRDLSHEEIAAAMRQQMPGGCPEPTPAA